MAVGHALEHVGEVGVRLHVVELRGFNQRADRRPAPGTAVAAGEQMVLAAQRNRPDGALDRIGVEFDAAIIKSSNSSYAALKPARSVSVRPLFRRYVPTMRQTQ